MENHLTSVSGAATAAFTYDGDGNRVKSVVGATTTLFVGSHYESSGGVVTKYYLAGGTRVAMRKGSPFYWLLSDHLGSTSKVATSVGTLHSQLLGFYSSLCLKCGNWITRRIDSILKRGGPVAKIKRRYVLLPGLVLLILCGFSVFRFGFPPLPPPTPTPLPPDWFTNWLTDPVCQPPCWQGITPGVTTMTETVEILQELPWVRIDFGPERPLPNKGDVTIEWSFDPPSSGGGMAFAFDDGLISDFFLKGYLSTTLQEVIDSYGFPSNVFISSCDVGMCQTKLIYVTSGMMVDLFLDWDHDVKGDVTVSPNDEVNGIEFFVPGEKGFLAAYPQYSDSFPRWSYPWEGYTKYAFR